MDTPQYKSYGGTSVTPQYQSYGETSARRETPAITFKVPMTPISKAKARKRRVNVLDEDEYVEKVEKIIERDFFPELDKLKAQNEYIEARERKDYNTMSRLEEKYSGCRPGTGRLQSPATFETPQDEPRENDPRRGELPAPGPGGPQLRAGVAPAVENKEEEEEDKVTLDKFLANNTSEDNESFIDIQTENERKHRVKNSWMYKDERLYLEMKNDQMALPSIEQQAELPVKKLNVDTWTYQNINSVFHNPDGLELSEQEKMDRAKKEKIIKHEHTRLAKMPWKTEKQMEQMRKEASQKEAAAAGKVGIDGKELVRPETPSVNGFKLMSMTPSPQLGVGDSPLMTWGQVESTPYMLPGSDTPVVAHQGAGFSIKEMSQRDRIAMQLADNNSKYYRERKSKAIAQAKSSIKAGKKGGKAGLAEMSPAAQRLASGKLGIRLGTDPMLAASYTPSPARQAGTPRSSATPSRTPTRKTPTPGLARKSDITDNLLDIKIGGKAKVNTDNLLNLTSSSRHRAADYFDKSKK